MNQAAADCLTTNFTENRWSNFSGGLQFDDHCFLDLCDVWCFIETKEVNNNNRKLPAYHSVTLLLLSHPTSLSLSLSLSLFCLSISLSVFLSPTHSPFSSSPQHVLVENKQLEGQVKQLTSDLVSATQEMESMSDEMARVKVGMPTGLLLLC